MMRQQRLADRAQNCASVRSCTARVRQRRRKRLDHLDNLGDLALVVRQRDVLAQHVGADEKAGWRKVARKNRAAWSDLVVAVRHDLDGDAFVLGAAEGAGNAQLEAADQLVFLDDGEADEHQRTIAKQNRITLMAGPKRLWVCRNDIAALKAGDINALAEEERTCCQLALRC